MLALNYLGCMFNALTFTNGTKFGNATFYWIFILSTVILAASRTLGPVKFAQKIEAKAQKKNEPVILPKTREQSDLSEPKGDIVTPADTKKEAVQIPSRDVAP